MDVWGSAKNHGASLPLQACAGCAAALMARGTKRQAPICGLDKYMRTGKRPTKRCRNVGVYLECPSGSAARLL